MSQVRTSARAIIQRDSKLLVIRYRDEHGDFYALPGGSQRHGEPLTETVVREVAEETGAVVRAGVLRLVRECRGSPDARGIPANLHQIELFFECELVSDDGSATDLDPGQAEALWMTIADLRTRCFFPQDFSMLSRTAEHSAIWAWSDPLSGSSAGMRSGLRRSPRIDYLICQA